MEDAAALPWHKTRGGKFFLALIGIILFAAVIFLSLFGYYLWKIKHGGATAVAREFQTNKFTPLGRSPAPAVRIINIEPYIHSFNPTIGNPRAPITIVAFIDFECPFCQAGYPLFGRIMDKYAPVTRVVFKQFPIASLHPNSLPAANASACAQEQGKFWPYYDKLFHDKTLTRDALLAEAQKVGLKKEAFAVCLNGAVHEPDIDQDIADGITLGIRGTPTYFVNQRKIEGVVDETTWDKIILESLQKK